MEWDAWGVGEFRKQLSPQVVSLLQAALGVSAEQAPPPTESDAVLRPTALTSAHRDALESLLGAEQVRTDDATRLRHAGGKSTPDLLRRKDTQPQDAPDAVVLPGSHDEVLALLQWCADQSVAAVPFGGGTSVVGGVDPVRGDFAEVLALDLRRLDALVSLDAVSGIAVLEAGVTGPQAEALLGAHGFSLGHFPQSFQFATIGGFAATRSSGQASAGYGRFDDMVERITVATPSGTLELGRGPGSAAGPDLRQLFVGSEGVLGIITSVAVRVHPVPETTAYQAWSFPDFETGAAALRTVIQSGAAPTVMRLSDEAETGLNLALASKVGGESPTAGCLSVTTFEGTAAHVQSRYAEATAVLTAAGGTALGEQPARDWEHGRFDAPYLRDALLNAGAIVETLETATTWSNLSNLRGAVTGALTESLAGQGTPPLVMCHISHTYPTGASLYFTVVCAQAADPLAQWAVAKKAAGDAIVAAGGTITHHHAVGRDHQPWMVDEIGELGGKVLRAVKDALDPTGILNPGKLLP
ncbi:FAD-binding oxidoreductase [Rhodococcus tukisamuensis]|uniref:Alkyldihydroxyacetonephosphate synthase n=1 Tax=Rhodococcus tukisamuensis TaxID=168276 RepID=A0A1G6R582_9NOCA|nr:FAD-binding oxidoreductase [Rhodococcus tukisamuensis]SDC99434.1 alkyldihydroxyacetonephosphate synthase [Rhodococcus tukisamuensis]